MGRRAGRYVLAILCLLPAVAFAQQQCQSYDVACQSTEFHERLKEQHAQEDRENQRGAYEAQMLLLQEQRNQILEQQWHVPPVQSVPQ